MEQLIFERATVGELAAANFRYAGVFNAFHIDFCCGGKKTVGEACATAEVPVESVIEALRVASTAAGSGASHDFQSWTAGFLADYIVNVHHRYVRESLLVLLQYSEKVARVHGGQHPEVVTIAEVFQQIMDELASHMFKEERILFPYIRALQSAAEGNMPYQRPLFGFAQNPIRMMEAEHEQVGELVRRIRELSGNFVPPAEACNSYRFLYGKLAEFEVDLHQHIHLENNILFPKSVALETSVTQPAATADVS